MYADHVIQCLKNLLFSLIVRIIGFEPPSCKQWELTGDFGDSLQIHQSLTCQLLVAPEISIFIATD